MLRSIARTALAVVGLAVAVYATASLTGGWLGTPPWCTSVMAGACEKSGRVDPGADS